MKWEHKIGIAITCTFLCLVGAVLGLKMQEPTPAESPKVAANDPGASAPPTHEKKASISFDDKEMSLTNIPDSSGLPSPLPNHKEKAPTEKAQATLEPPLGVTQPAPSPAPSMMDASAAKKKPATDKTNPSLGATLSPSGPVESKPVKPPVAGAEEWKKDSGGPGGNKQSATPATPKSDTRTAPPTSPILPETKKQPPVNPSVSPTIVPAGGIEPPLSPPDTQIKPVPAPTSPTVPTPSGPGTGATPAPITPAPIALGNPTNSAAPSVQPATPSIAQQPTVTPNALNSKDKEKITPYMTPVPAMPKTPSTPTSPPTPSVNPAPITSVNPAIVSPTPAPMPTPVVDPGPTPTPAPAAPPSPPKPPSDGSSFIPDQTSSASGPVGVKPAPLPFPVPPPSSPLASAPEKPAPPPPQPASTGASVTVYDEQDYSCKNGDSWEEISKRFYMTDRYAKALARHNQNHARASARIRDTGQLAPGERIFVPQSYVLEERYADAIPRPTTPTSATTPATPVSPGSSAPPQPPAPPQP